MSSALRPRWLAGVLVIAIGVSGCGARHAGADATADFAAVAGTLDRTAPGRGLDEFGVRSDDQPMAYAVVLSAAMLRFQQTRSPAMLRLARRCGSWLIGHPDENHDGVVGWGVPDPRDAFRDGSVDPPNTEYTVVTALAARGLQDWAAGDRRAPRRRVARVLAHAFEPYADGRGLTPSGLLAYSLSASDRRYDVFSASTFLAGQMQRYAATLAPGPARDELEVVADRAMLALYYGRRADRSGDWYWSYTRQSAQPNDLINAAYLIIGLRSYQRWGGHLARRFRTARVEDYLAQFVSRDDLHWLQFPRTLPTGRAASGAPLWDLGTAMYAVTTSPDLRFLTHSLRVEAMTVWRQRTRPEPAPFTAHLLLGLAAAAGHGG